MNVYNKVFLVKSCIAVDAGFTAFSLYEGDMLFTNNERICTLVYGKEKNELHLKEHNQRVFTSIRIDNKVGWSPLSRSIGVDLEDITVQWNRDKVLNEIL